MTPNGYFRIAIVAAGLLLGLLAGRISERASQVEEARETADALRKEVTALKVSHEALAEVAITREELATHIRANRQTVRIQLDKVTNESPDAAAYLGERIPDSVRNAYAD